MILFVFIDPSMEMCLCPVCKLLCMQPYHPLTSDSLMEVGYSFVGGATTITCKIHAGEQPNLVRNYLLLFTYLFI